MEQVCHLAQLPFAFKRIAIMSDCHAGYGMPVGGVFAAKHEVMPYAIGVDIGCGVSAWRTDVRSETLREPHTGQGTKLQAVVSRIQRNIPTGLPPRGVHKLPQNVDTLASSTPFAALGDDGRWPEALKGAWGAAAYQIGTLGSGNHFLELDTDEEGFVWLMLHSGSRALGKTVCDHFNATAIGLNERYHSVVPKAWQLAFLPADSDEGRAYLAWMGVCLAYAEENRNRMLASMAAALGAEVPDAGVTEQIETHHNYAALENHFGANVWVHRKGACRARQGDPVLVPGSMETGSYVCRGLGNVESFCSSAHGAGRTMSRTAARKARTVQDMVESLRRKGIVLATHKVEAVLDEAGHSYKDVATVIANQADLAEVVHTLTPLGVIKG